MGLTSRDEEAPLKKRPLRTTVNPPKELEVTINPADMEDAEFEEFCEANTGPLEADPEFREGLRKKLLKLIKSLYGLWMLYLGGMNTFH